MVISQPEHRALLFIVLSISLERCNSSSCRFHGDNSSTTNIKGMFVFGSSLVDNGNNNFLQTASHANYLPYGMDFPVMPASGRFTNGENVVDLLAKHLRLPYIPPFLSPTSKGPNITRGVNFASGGSGIMDETGSLMGEVMSLKEQVMAFEGKTLRQLEAELGCEIKDFMSRFMFVFGTGGNDYSFNYFLKHPPGSAADTDQNLHAFTSNLTSSLSMHLQKLYRLGGRKFVLMSVNPIGCYLYVKKATRGCIDYMNRAARVFNSQLISIVDSLPTQLPQSHFVYVNSYNIIQDILDDPISKGFTKADEPCCEVPTIQQGGNGILCKPGGTTCSNRSRYVFFDGIHPSEAVNARISTAAFASSLTSEVYPYNVGCLASLF